MILREYLKEKTELLAASAIPDAENEAWVIAAEWMQTTAPNPTDWKRCMSFGSDNSIFIARIRAR